MNIKSWFSRQKAWFQGGIIGSMVCIALFIFYILIYAPVIKAVYGGTLPEWAMTLPLATGHLLPILSSFFVPYGFLCAFTKPACTAWSAFNAPGAVPWNLETGEAGYCIRQTLEPTSFCAGFSEGIGFLGLALMLVIVYFIIGALVGSFIQILRKKFS